MNSYFSMYSAYCHKILRTATTAVNMILSTSMIIMIDDSVVVESSLNKHVGFCGSFEVQYHILYFSKPKLYWF